MKAAIVGEAVKKIAALLWKYVGEWWHKKQLCTLWGERMIGEAQLVDEESICGGGGGETSMS